ncbi:MAG TPA: aromatic amino acid lyase [Acidimicrobiales bacterium]|nr:aromatic amino acid lyase [Acidimicrobiales bacterium]
MTVVLDGRGLTLDQLLRVARQNEPVALDPAAAARMHAARQVVEGALSSGTPVYGLTTGVNAKKGSSVVGDQAGFNRLLLASHRVGTGDPAPADVVRATTAQLVNGLAGGSAGVRPELAEALLQALNQGRLPRVRMLGSLGQGDLAPMADLALGLLDGFSLAANEALALVDNNAFSTALTALALSDVTRLLDTLDVAAALDFEAFVANVGALHPAVARSRPYPGLQTTLFHLRALLEGSSLWEEGEARNLQDPLSLRCVAQVHGAARDTLAFATGQLAIELNASQGNPIVAAEEGRVVSVGNFDVLPLAAAGDFLRVALAPVLTAAAERTVKLLQAPLTDLSQGLATVEPSPEDALSELGVAAVALAAEARLLGQPVSFEQTSSSVAQGIEDRMTMAPLGARRLTELVGLGERLVALELVVAAQAVDLRRTWSPGRARSLGRGSGRAYRLVRTAVPFTGEGDEPPCDLEPVRALVASGALVGEEGHAGG